MVLCSQTFGGQARWPLYQWSCFIEELSPPFPTGRVVVLEFHSCVVGPRQSFHREVTVSLCPFGYKMTIRTSPGIYEGNLISTNRRHWLTDVLLP